MKWLDNSVCLYSIEKFITLTFEIGKEEEKGIFFKGRLVNDKEEVIRYCSLEDIQKIAELTDDFENTAFAKEINKQIKFIPHRLVPIMYLRLCDFIEDENRKIFDIDNEIGEALQEIGKEILRK